MPDVKYLKLLRSDQFGNEPKAADMGESQLAINFKTKKVFTKDSAGKVITLTERAIIVDAIITGNLPQYQSNVRSTYLVQRQHAAALQGLPDSVKDAIAQQNVHQKEQHTLTITGVPTSGGSYTPLAGTTVSYTTGQAANNFANQLAAALGTRSDLTVAVAANVVTITYNDYKSHTLPTALNQNGIQVTVARTVVGSEGDHLWGIVGAKDNAWYLEDIAENIDYHIVYSRADQALYMINGSALQEIVLDWVSNDEIPTTGNPARNVTNAQKYITPSQVKEMHDAIRMYSDFEAIDGAPGISITDANHRQHKTFYVVKDGTVTIGATTYNVKVGDTLYKGAAGWVHNQAAQGGASSNSITVTISKTAHGFVTGDMVYFDNTTDSYKKAKADLANTAGITAFVEKVDNDNFKATFSGVISGLPASMGLTAGQTYYLDQATAGSTRATIPTTGLVKFCYQALSTSSILVLPLLAYDASASASASGGSYTQAELINILSNNKGAGADHFFAGDGTFKKISHPTLFSNIKSAGKPIGGRQADYPETSNSVEITVQEKMDGQYIRFDGFTITDPVRQWRLIFDDAAFEVNGVFMILNHSDRDVYIASNTKQFRVADLDRVKDQNAFVIEKHEFAIMVANQGTAWHVLQSAPPKLVNDSAAVTSTNQTYSVKKLLASIKALIDDNAAETTKDKTWSIDKIVDRITGLIDDNVAHDSGDTDVTWSVAKIVGYITSLIKDDAYATDKIWSSKKSFDAVAEAQNHRLIESSFASLNTTMHLDAFYQAGFIKKSASGGASNIHGIEGRTPWGDYYDLNGKPVVSGRVSSRPGYYGVDMSASDNTYFTMRRRLGGDAAGTPSQIFDEREFSIIAVVRPRSVAGALQGIRPNDYQAIIHGGGVALGMSSFGFAFGTEVTSGDIEEVEPGSLTNAQLNKDYICIASRETNGYWSLDVRGDNKYSALLRSQFTRAQSLPTSGAVEIGRSANGKYFDGFIFELVVVNRAIYDDREDYFNYFARKWGIDI